MSFPKPIRLASYSWTLLSLYEAGWLGWGTLVFAAYCVGWMIYWTWDS
jgi:hypothetical protein